MINEKEDIINKKIYSEIKKCIGIIFERKSSLKILNELRFELQVKINERELELYKEYMKILISRRIKNIEPALVPIDRFDEIIPLEALEKYKQMLEVSAFTSYYICKDGSLYYLVSFIRYENCFVYFHLGIEWECEDPTEVWFTYYFEQ